MKASEIAKLVGGTFDGPADPEITGVAALDRASGSELSFVAHPKYLPYLAESEAGAILVTETLIPRGSTTLPRIVVKDVHRALAEVLRRFHPEPTIPEGIHPTAVIGRNVRIETGVRIGACAVIGDDCTIGADTFLYPDVALCSKVHVGARCTSHTGARSGTAAVGHTSVDGPHS